MSFLNQLNQMFDLQTVAMLLIRVLAALLCLSVHELCHGAAAYAMGDPTARVNGRLSLNPLHHLDPFGLLLLITAGFGWAKPVPVNPGYFKNPKRGMALTALAGPASNFAMAFAGGAVLSFWYGSLTTEVTFGQLWGMALLAVFIWMNLGLGIFNLFPIPPLDGSKVLFSLLPDRIYMLILTYERYVMLALFALVFFGVLDGPLSFLLTHFAQGLCHLVGLPIDVLYILLNYVFA